MHSLINLSIRAVDNHGDTVALAVVLVRWRSTKPLSKVVLVAVASTVQQQLLPVWLVVSVLKHRAALWSIATSIAAAAAAFDVR